MIERKVMHRLRLTEQAVRWVQWRGSAKCVHGGGDVRHSGGAVVHGERGLHEGGAEADGGEEAGEQVGVCQGVSCLLQETNNTGFGWAVETS